MEKLSSYDTTGLLLPLVILLCRRKVVVAVDEKAAAVAVEAAEVLGKAAEAVTYTKVSPAAQPLVCERGKA